MEIMLPWLFILYKEHPNWLESLVRRLGFQGEWKKNTLIKWWSEEEQCFGAQWDTNYMRTWREVCNLVPELDWW
jgi:hypothetical protein